MASAKEGTLCQSRRDGWPLQVTCQDLGRHHAARRSQSPGGEAGTAPWTQRSGRLMLTDLLMLSVSYGGYVSVSVVNRKVLVLKVT